MLLRRALFELELGAGDRVAVGVHRGMSELGRDQLLEILGEHVLEDLGLGVHPIPGHPQRIRQEALDQPVMADHLQRHAPPVDSEAHTPVGDMGREAQLVELLEHRRDRPRRDAQALGQGIGRHGLIAARLQREDRLRIVLDRRRTQHLLGGHHIKSMARQEICQGPPEDKVGRDEDATAAAAGAVLPAPSPGRPARAGGSARAGARARTAQGRRPQRDRAARERRRACPSRSCTALARGGSLKLDGLAGRCAGPELGS